MSSQDKKDYPLETQRSFLFGDQGGNGRGYQRAKHATHTPSTKTWKAGKGKKPKKTKPRVDLVASDIVLTVGPAAAVKAAVLQVSTHVEWSGYGPLTGNEEDGYVLHDFYYTSTGDTHADTNLEPETIAETWAKIAEDGYPAERLAWVHCHPWSKNPGWSGTDDKAAEQQAAMAGEQVSVLFGKDTATARRDTADGVHQRLNVEMQWGDYQADVDKAKEADYGDVGYYYGGGYDWQRAEGGGYYKVLPSPKKDKEDNADPLPRSYNAAMCHCCGLSNITMHCDGCGKPTCMRCFEIFNLEEDTLICEDCVAAISVEPCALCGEPIPADVIEYRYEGAELCPSCWRTLTGSRMEVSVYSE